MTPAPSPGLTWILSSKEMGPILSSSTNSIIAAFDLLTIEQQKALVEELTRRANDRRESEKQTVVEIEVLGGYDQTYDDQNTKFTLNNEVIAAVRQLSNRQQLQDYLKNLSDDEILWRYRFLQYRYLADGTLWQIFANAHIHRNVANSSRIEESGLMRFNHIT